MLVVYMVEYILGKQYILMVLPVYSEYIPVKSSPIFVAFFSLELQYHSNLMSHSLTVIDNEQFNNCYLKQHGTRLVSECLSH